MDHKDYLSLKYATNAYNLILQDVFQTVGFISGGFCPEPCEHTTLQDTNPEMYMKLYKLWKYSKTVQSTVDQVLSQHTFD